MLFLIKFIEGISLLEIIHRIQVIPRYGLIKKESIRASIGGKEIPNFPVSHVLLLPSQLRETIFKHIRNIKVIRFDFKGHNKEVFDYFSRDYDKEIFKYWKETIQVWHAFNKNKEWRYNEPISGVENCVERLKEKWEYGIDNIDQEINFIKNNITNFIEKKDEKYVKSIPFEVYNEIVQRLPENQKMEWVTKINPEGREDVVKMKRIEAIGELDIDKMKEEEFQDILKIINEDKTEMKWIKKIDERLQNTLKEVK